MFQKDQNKLSQKITKLIKADPILTLAIFLGVALIVVGLVLNLNWQFTPAEEIEIISEEEQTTGVVVVDVAGAVATSGVYQLDLPARVADAIEAAGGFAANADLNFVAKNLNLAAKLSDGAKIYIPVVGETSQMRGVSTVTGKININSANLAELDRLPGVGPVTAQKIIDGRPYSTVDELLTKKILGPSTFEKLKDQVVIF